MADIHDDNVKLGDLIRKRRKLCKLTQKDLAKHLGISVQQMQKYESGKNRISAVNLITIEELIGAIKSDFPINLPSGKVNNFFSESAKVSPKLVNAVEQLTVQQQKLLYKFIASMNVCK